MLRNPILWLSLLFIGVALALADVGGCGHPGVAPTPEPPLLNPASTRELAPPAALGPSVFEKEGFQPRSDMAQITLRWALVRFDAPPDALPKDAHGKVTKLEPGAEGLLTFLKKELPERTVTLANEGQLTLNDARGRLFPLHSPAPDAPKIIVQVDGLEPGRSKDGPGVRGLLTARQFGTAASMLAPRFYPLEEVLLLCGPLPSLSGKKEAWALYASLTTGSRETPDRPIFGGHPRERRTGLRPQ